MKHDTELHNPIRVKTRQSSSASNMADLVRPAQIVELMGDLRALRGISSSGSDLRIRIHSYAQQNTKGMGKFATYSFRCANHTESYKLAQRLKGLKKVAPTERRRRVMGMEF